MAKRRINHEGSLTLRKDGLWVGRVSHEGKRIAAYGGTKEQARQKLRELIKKQEQGQSLVTTAMPLREYLAQWLADNKYRLSNTRNNTQGHPGRGWSRYQLVRLAGRKRLAEGDTPIRVGRVSLEGGSYGKAQIERRRVYHIP